MPDKCSVLNDRERKEFAALYLSWCDARAAKDYILADCLRAELTAKGVDAECNWQAVFESQDARVNRLAARYVYGEE